MRAIRAVAPTVALLLLLAPAAPLLGDSEPRIEPFGGIRWNDRIEDVAERLGSLAGERKAELSVGFRDRATAFPFGTRAFPPGDGERLAASVSSIVREYLDGMEAARGRGDDRIYRGFNLHVLGVLFDKSGQRKSFLDAEVRLTVRKVMFEGIPFDVTATFRTHPGAGLTERYVMPVAGTPHVLPLVLSGVALAARGPAARKDFAAVDGALRKRFEGFRPCRTAGGEGWCDARGVSVSRSAGGDDGISVRFDAEKFWTAGLDAVYKEHLATVEGRSRRCHAKRQVDA